MEEIFMNSKKTSDKLGSLAGKVLSDSNSSNIQKVLAGSVLSQKSPNHQTGAKLEDVASKVLKSEKYNDTTKSLAGSVLSQSNKKR
jgi:hypothetical protein